MRARAAAILILLLLVPLVTGALAPAARAADGISLAQDEGADETDETEAENVGGQEGTEPETEVGTEEGQTEPAEEESGPVWTYQMVWLSLGLVLLLGLGMARWYYMLVGRRQRDGV